MDSLKRLLLVGNFISRTTGYRQVCEDLAERLAANGWSVLTTSHLARPGARLIDMLGTILRSRGFYWVAQVDVFSGRAFLWAEAACLALRRVRKPYVLTLHGGNLPEFARRHFGRVKRLLNSAASVTAPSRYLARELKSLRPDIRVIPNGLDLHAYAYHKRTRPRPRLLWLRAFHHIYQPSFAPKVAARLAPEFPDLSLIMVGPDKGDGSLAKVQKTAQALGVTPRLLLTGPVAKPEVPVWLNAGDIFLNTATMDNTPLSVLEAMAAGLCIVSTKVGGIPHLLRHEEEGLLTPPSDSAAMAAAVRRVLTEPGLAGRLSRNARRKAEQFDWINILPQWEALLKNIYQQITVK